MADQQHGNSIVVIGASAGGIDALSTLVGTLPADLPAPIVIAQHLDPRRESHLSDILNRRSTLPVQIVTDRETLLPGTIYVVPSNNHVEISAGEVFVHPDHIRPPSPSVDL